MMSEDVMEAPELVEIVRRLRAQRSDDGYVEAKTAVGGLPKDVWPSISAFANTNGGTVILGLNEKDNFRPAEGFTPGPVLDALSEGLSEGPRKTAAKVTPVPDVDVSQVEFEGAVVVALRVHPLEGVEAPATSPTKASSEVLTAVGTIRTSACPTTRSSW